MEIAWRGVTVIVGAFLVQLTFGTTFTDGNMVPYLISYLHARIDSSTLISNTILISAIHPICQAALLIPSGYLDARIGTRPTVLISAIVMSAAVFLTYFTIKVSFALVFLTYGLLLGLGISIGYASTITCCMKWFPNNRGLASGIVVAGYGLGASIFNPVQSFMVNPDNISPTKDGYFENVGLLNELPDTLAHLAAIYFLIQVIGILLIDEPSKINQEKVHSSETKSLTPLEALRRREMWILWITVFCNGCTVGFFNPMYKTYGQTFIHDDLYLALVGSLMSILNACGRLVWGFLIDKYTYTPCMTMVTAGITVLMFTMPATSVGGKAMYTVWSAAFFFFVSGTYVLIPAVSVTCFGAKYMTANYGMLFSGLIAAGTLTVVLTSTLLDKIGYNGMFFILGGMGLLGLLMTFAFQHERKKQDGNNNPDFTDIESSPTRKTTSHQCDQISNDLKETLPNKYGTFAR